jgi:hypothetical protein
MLVGNVVTTGHHARAVFPNYSLKRKINKINIKNELNGLGNNCIHDKVQLTLFRRNPHVIPTFSYHHCTPCPNIPHTISCTYMT